MGRRGTKPRRRNGRQEGKIEVLLEGGQHPEVPVLDAQPENVDHGNGKEPEAIPHREPLRPADQVQDQEEHGPQHRHVHAERPDPEAAVEPVQGLEGENLLQHVSKLTRKPLRHGVKGPLQVGRHSEPMCKPPPCPREEKPHSDIGKDIRNELRSGHSSASIRTRSTDRSLTARCRGRSSVVKPSGRSAPVRTQTHPVGFERPASLQAPLAGPVGKSS